jgi:hypothetical protein
MPKNKFNRIPDPLDNKFYRFDGVDFDHFKEIALYGVKETPPDVQKMLNFNIKNNILISKHYREFKDNLSHLFQSVHLNKAKQAALKRQ